MEYLEKLFAESLFRLLISEVIPVTLSASLSGRVSDDIFVGFFKGIQGKKFDLILGRFSTGIFQKEFPNKLLKELLVKFLKKLAEKFLEKSMQGFLNVFFISFLGESLSEFFNEFLKKICE